MKSTLLFLIFILCFCLDEIRAQEFEWGFNIGNWYTERADAVVSADSGSVIVLANFRDSVDFDPDTSEYYLDSQGFVDMVLQKLDSNGQLLWVKQVGGTNYLRPRHLTCDNSGNIYVTGGFEGTVDFDPGVNTQYLTSSSRDIFILKLDPDGGFLWSKKIGYIYEDEGEAITIDPFGDVYVTGTYYGDVDFDPGSGTYTVNNIGNYDVFVLKLRANGDFAWARGFGSYSTDYGRGISCDSKGNVYTTGNINGNADLNPASGPLNQYTIYCDAAGYIQKLDSTGSFVWAVQMGEENSVGFDIAIDEYDCIYSVGGFSDTFDFDSDTIGEEILISVGGDVFIQKLDTNANLIWAKSIGGDSLDFAVEMTLDKHNAIYISGLFHGEMDVDPDSSVELISSTGETDYFLVRLDNNGSFSWGHPFGSLVGEDLADIIVNDRMDIYGVGMFRDTLDLDFQGGVYEISQEGYQDYFVAKWNQCLPSISFDTHYACTSHTWIDSNTYFNSNFSAQVILENAQGCDSIIQLNLFINDSVFEQSVISCDSFLWNANLNTYSASGIYYDSAISSSGCDSVNVLELQVLSSSVYIDSQSSCDSLTWIDGNTYTSATSEPFLIDTNAVGCDSIIELDLIVYNSSFSVDSIVACDSITWIDGNSYDSSNFSSLYPLQTQTGCDSIIQLALTISHSQSAYDTIEACSPYEWIDGNTYTTVDSFAQVVYSSQAGCDSTITASLNLVEVDTVVTNLGDSLRSESVIGTYQWLVCDSGYTAIIGENNQVLIPTLSGSYAVEVNQVGCKDTSACYEVIVIGIKENEPEVIDIFPNPAQDVIMINDAFNSNYSITDIKGSVILQGTIMNNAMDVSALPSGAYFIQISGEDAVKQGKFVKL